MITKSRYLINSSHFSYKILQYEFPNRVVPWSISHLNLTIPHSTHRNQRSFRKRHDVLGESNGWDAPQEDAWQVAVFWALRITELEFEYCRFGVSNSVYLLFLPFVLGKNNPRQIGLARVITDEVSLAYLTDVYVLEEFQGKGLGKWLIECVEAHISEWPELRRVLLLTSHSGKMYEETLGVKPFLQGGHGITIFSKKGKGSPLEGWDVCRSRSIVSHPSKMALLMFNFCFIFWPDVRSLSICLPDLSELLWLRPF